MPHSEKSAQRMCGALFGEEEKDEARGGREMVTRENKS